MLVSFIIPHKGRENLLELTIQSILDLDFDLKKIEIIVVTQNKTLECPNIAWKTVHLKILSRLEHETISALRNTGIDYASGEYLAFLDADIQLSRNWLNAMFEELKAKPERVLISAIQQCDSNAGKIEKIRVLLNNTSADRTVEFLGGGNLFMNRKIFQKVGGFPEDLATCEDYYFTDKVNQLGEVYCTSKASFIHLGEDKNYHEMFRKEIWRGQSNLQSLRGRKIPFREIPSLLTPLWQTLFLLTIIFSFFGGEVIFTLLFLIMFCLPILLYTTRLYRIGKNSISFGDSLWFYCIYLAARTIGAAIGIFKIIRI